MDVDQPIRDFNEDLYDSECDNKYVDSLPEVNNNFVMAELPDQDCIAEAKETHVDTGFDSLVEPSAMCLSKRRAEEDFRVRLFADVNLSEHEGPALQEHSRETDGNDVKDICIDEGLPIKVKIRVEDIFKDPKQTVHGNYPVKQEEFGSKNEKVDGEWSIPVGLKSSSDLACEKDFNSCESKVPVHQHESENETKKMVLRDFLKEKVFETISMPNKAADDSQLKPSAGDRCKNEQDIAHKNTSKESEVRSSSLASEETDDDRKIETSLMETEHAKGVTNNSSLLTAVNNKGEKIASSVNHPQLPDAAHMPRRHDLFLRAFEHLTASAPIRDHFESSFASVEHCTGSITYSGPIAYSGSLSHRSDASTASTRSFAFPVLNNEWNFSPVRMQKADRRHLRRHRGWMNGLFCCKF